MIVQFLWLMHHHFARDPHLLQDRNAIALVVSGEFKFGISVPSIREIRCRRRRRRVLCQRLRLAVRCCNWPRFRLIYQWTASRKYIPTAARIDFVSSATKSRSCLSPRIDPDLAETVEQQNVRSIYATHIFFLKLIFGMKLNPFYLQQNRTSFPQVSKNIYILHSLTNFMLVITPLTQLLMNYYNNSMSHRWSFSLLQACFLSSFMLRHAITRILRCLKSTCGIFPRSNARKYIKE